jgi:hypothetical protein
MEANIASAAREIKQIKSRTAQVQHVPGVSFLPRGPMTAVLINIRFKPTQYIVEP